MVMRPSQRSVRLSSALCLLVVVSAQTGAQVAYDTPAGRVEVLGLNRWTLQMLQDSVRRYRPGLELHEGACMALLRDSLHFAEASVERFTSAMPGRPATVLFTIKVIEPQDAGLVQWDNRERNDFTSLLPDYAPLVLAVTDSTGAVWRGRILHWLQFYHDDSARRSATLARAPETARADAGLVWQFLDVRRAEADRARAMRTLKGDGFPVNRMIAAAVLTNFGGNDSTWWALVRALRDPNDAVREFASSVLNGLPGRPVDWAPATSDLRLLLGGTGLPFMGTVLAVLDRTAVSREMASALLHDNARWLLATLASEHPADSGAAHRILVRLNRGVDLGPSRADWARWALAL
jgi:hypothetical protein